MQVLGTSNAKQGPDKNYNAYKDFNDIETDSQIICATMEYFQMTDIEGI